MKKSEKGKLQAQLTSSFPMFVVARRNEYGQYHFLSQSSSQSYPYGLDIETSFIQKNVQHSRGREISIGIQIFKSEIELRDHVYHILKRYHLSERAAETGRAANYLVSMGAAFTDARHIRAESYWNRIPEYRMTYKTRDLIPGNLFCVNVTARDATPLALLFKENDTHGLIEVYFKKGETTPIDLLI